MLRECRRKAGWHRYLEWEARDRAGSVGDGAGGSLREAGSHSPPTNYQSPLLVPEPKGGVQI